MSGCVLFHALVAPEPWQIEASVVIQLMVVAAPSVKAVGLAERRIVGGGFIGGVSVKAIALLVVPCLLAVTR